MTNLIRNGEISISPPDIEGQSKDYLSQIQPRTGSLGNDWFYRSLDPPKNSASGIVVLFNSPGRKNRILGSYPVPIPGTTGKAIAICGQCFLCNRTFYNYKPSTIYKISFYGAGRLGYVGNDAFNPKQYPNSGNTINIFLSKNFYNEPEIKKDILIASNIIPVVNIFQAYEFYITIPINGGGQYFLYFEGTNSDGRYQDPTFGRPRYTYKGTAITSVLIEEINQPNLIINGDFSRQEIPNGSYISSVPNQYPEVWSGPSQDEFLFLVRNNPAYYSLPYPYQALAIRLGGLLTSNRMKLIPGQYLLYFQGCNRLSRGWEANSFDISAEAIIRIGVSIRVPILNGIEITNNAGNYKSYSATFTIDNPAEYDYQIYFRGVSLRGNKESAITNVILFRIR